MVQPARAAASYYALLPRLIAVTTEELAAAPTDVDVPATVSGALAALPALRALRPRVLAELPAHPVACIDELEDLALAAWFANVRDEMSGTTAPDIAQLTARAEQLREDLLIAGEALARKALIDGARLGAIRSHDARADLAADLLALFELFLWNWSTVQNKTAVTQEEVAEAGDLAQRLIVALSQKKEASAPAGVTDFRGRALALLARAWDECTRAAAYLRWHDDDAAETTPALFGRRTRGGGAAKKAARASAATASGSEGDKRAAPAASPTDGEAAAPASSAAAPTAEAADEPADGAPGAEERATA